VLITSIMSGVLKKLFKKKTDGDGEDVGAVASPKATPERPANPDAAVAEADDLAVVEDVRGLGALADVVHAATPDAAKVKGPERRSVRDLVHLRDGGAALYRHLEQDARERALVRDKQDRSAPSLHIPVPGQLTSIMILIIRILF
jgi:hypothetical protein